MDDSGLPLSFPSALSPSTPLSPRSGGLAGRGGERGGSPCSFPLVVGWFASLMAEYGFPSSDWRSCRVLLLFAFGVVSFLYGGDGSTVSSLDGPLNKFLPDLAGSAALCLSFPVSQISVKPADLFPFLVLNKSPCFSRFHPMLPGILLVLAGCQLLAGCSLLVILRLSLSGSLIWRRPSMSHASKITMVVEEKLWGDGDPDWVRAQPRWSSRRGLGSCVRGRLPVVFVSPSNLLAEWRLFFFLPAMMPNGRQCGFSMKSMARCHGGFAVPSGAVPGDDEAWFLREQLGARLQSPSAIWGPLCICQGPVCKFMFVKGPVVRCYASPVHI